MTTTMPLLPMWTVANSSHPTSDCEACRTAAQTSAQKLRQRKATRTTTTITTGDTEHRVTTKLSERQLHLHKDSPLTPQDLTDAERDRLRSAQPGAVVLLNKNPDNTFNINGKAVSMCVECSAGFIAQRVELNRLMQNHLHEAHDISASLLP